jgi:hypothetical protein
LDIPLGQIFGNLPYQVYSAMPGDQAPDMLVVRKVQGTWDLARGQRRILKQGAARGGYGGSGGEVIDNSRWRQSTRLVAPILALLRRVSVSLLRAGHALARRLACRGYGRRIVIVAEE